MIIYYMNWALLKLNFSIDQKRALAEKFDQKIRQNESLENVLTWWLFHVLIYNLFSIEENIASRELYPIHALDDQEFFPGDFVVRTSINSDLGQVTSFKI